MSGRRAWRDGVYAVIHAQTQQQGHAEIERRCRLAGVSRTGYYRHWQASAPRQEEAWFATRSSGSALEHHDYGYRRITLLLKRSGWVVNHKRVLPAPSSRWRGRRMRRSWPALMGGELPSVTRPGGFAVQVADFSASIGVPTVFVRTLAEGRRVWDDLRVPAMRRPAVMPMLEVFPATVRPELQAIARAWEEGGAMKRRFSFWYWWAGLRR